VQYDEKISAVKSAKLKKKRPQDYRLVRKYDVMTIAGKEKLIKPISDGTVLYFLKVDEMFDVLYATHIAIGHGGRDRMVAELKHKYCNVTKESIMVFLSFCSYCQKKQPNPKKGLVSKPIVHTAFNSRAQIDLIDMQSQCYNDYRFILNYQDHLTKFVLLYGH